MIRPIVRPIVSGIARAVTGVTYKRRYAYNFDGVDDRAQLAYRAIDIDGDISIRWKQRGMNNSPATPRCIVTQCVSSTVSSREFQLRWQGNGGNLSCIVGGVEMSPTITPSPDGDYQLQITGSAVLVYKDGQIIGSRDVTRGGAREPSAVTLLGARNSGGTFPEVMLGTLFDVEINGTLWPMSAKDHDIQLPAPSGLGAELITPAVYETPFSKAAKWVKVADTWTIDNAAVQASDALIFLASLEMPTTGMIEFEIVSISGSLSCTNNMAAGSVFTTPGKKRFFYSDYGQIESKAWRFRVPTSGVAFSCIIKNISFKPLGTCNPLTMVNTTPERWEVV